MTDFSNGPSIGDFLRAGYPCLFLRTVEPKAAEDLVRKAIIELELDVQFGIWKVTTGLMLGEPNLTNERLNQQHDAMDLGEALAKIQDNPQPMCVIVHNVRQFINHNIIIQRLIDAVMAARLKGSHIIFVGPHLELPPELRTIITYIDIPLPGKDEIKKEYGRLLEAYSTDLDLPKSKTEQEELLVDAANAAVGLDLISAENAISLSMATTGRVDLEIIQAQKVSEVRKSDVLEFYPYTDITMDQVGGFAAYKEWCGRRKKAFSQEAREYGLPYPKGVLLVGLAGCLSEDTKIQLRKPDGRGGRYETMESLYYRWNDYDAGIRNGILKYKRRWEPGRTVKTTSIDEDRKSFFGNAINNVVFSGVKTVYKLTTNFGYEIECTSDHEFLTPDGQYIPMAGLHKGDAIVCKGEGILLCDRRTGRNLVRQQPNIVVGKHPNARLKVIKGMEEDGNPMDRYQNTGRIQKVLSIKKVGKKKTYDLQMDGPNHNFVANGFVVHNCGKSHTSKATAAYFKLPLLRLDIGKVYQSLVGSSEASIRMALQVAEAVSPVVLWIDEIEKSLSGANSGNLDSGVSARVISTLLTWQQEMRAPVMMVLTANDVSALPAMVYRRGRLDEVWAVDLPTFSERKEILDIHIKKVGRDPKNFNSALIAKKAVDFTGAELEGCIIDAMFAAFDEEREVSQQDIMKAVEETIPQAQRNREEIENLRKWVASRARLVSGKDIELNNGTKNKVRAINTRKKN